MVTPLVVRVPADGHEVKDLGSVPEVEEFGVAADQVAAHEDVHDAADEGDLLAQGDGFGVVPPGAQLLDACAHAFAVAVELFLSRRDAPPPLVHHALASHMALILQGLARLAHLLGLGGNSLLELLELLGERKVVEQVEHAEPIERREGLPVFLVRAASGERGLTGEARARLGVVGRPQGGRLDGIVVRDGSVGGGGTPARVWRHDGLAVGGGAFRLCVWFWSPHRGRSCILMPVVMRFPSQG